MVRRLRNRPRPDTHANQLRKAGGNWARRVYLVLLLVLAMGLGNYVWGDLLLFRADGIILCRRVDIAATSVVRVEEVFVTRGQSVEAGDLLLRVSSAEILDAIAEQTLRIAELAREEAALRSRVRRAEALLPLARRRALRMSEAAARLADPTAKSLVTADRLARALDDEYDAEAEQAQLSAESTALEAEIATLTSARAAAAEALKGLEHHYAAGEIRAGVSGTISAEVPAVGEVFAAATPLLSIHSGQEYVLAYLPSRYLLPINEGMRVRMSDGRLTASGEIVEILTISDTLPDAFRTAFKPGDRRQLARIRLSRPHSFPLFSDIRVTQEFRLQRVADAARAWLRGHRPAPGDDALAAVGQ